MLDKFDATHFNIPMRHHVTVLRLPGDHILVKDGWGMDMYDCSQSIEHPHMDFDIKHHLMNDFINNILWKLINHDTLRLNDLVIFLCEIL